ncbi:GNAT family N-acetyltransferase [Spirosoma oryzicola]|uniref:GNAT family N-acetyltransferase n=1 Tax=Spirosoma oryzicola TaxID=2898794 RepID=UPI001E46CF28|nr:GNAT family N-acetyltransferase [Spirosoma oryzicola]UHG89434.1 GNAT family N-acetyltransferase [Spirosoma oryzicola]
MSPLITTRLALLPIDLPTYDALFAGSDKLSQHLGIRVPEILSEFGMDGFEYTYTKLAADQSEGPWWLYLFIHRADQALIGVGGYKGKPDEAGMVEIGYEIYPHYRGQGLATETAQGLIDWAFDQPAVTIVQAHTLAEMSPSVRVLEKCGMTFNDAFDDPNDGAVWQWQLKRSYRDRASMALRAHRK